MHAVETHTYLGVDAVYAHAEGMGDSREQRPAGSAEFGVGRAGRGGEGKGKGQLGVGQGPGLECS